MKKRVFIYLRVSTKEQAEEGYSLGEQEERLIKYCEAMGWEVIRVFVDGGYSGSNIDRPAMQEMISEIQKGNADIVLVDKLDRLSRSQFDTLYLIQKVFNVNNCAFVSRAEAFDTSSPFGRAMVGILAVFAELERERIKERMKDGKEGRAKEGKYKGGGFLPTGYDYNEQSGILVVNDYEAMQIRELFELFNARTPVYTIMQILNEKGYKIKNRKWTEPRVRYIVENPVYIGKVRHNGKEYEGQHEAIVSMEVWNKAQDILKERDRKYEHMKQGRRYTSPLGAMIWCKNCGAKYHYRTNGKNQDGSQRAYYSCYSRSKSDKTLIKDPNCKNTIYRDFKLEEIVYNEVFKLNVEYIQNIHDSIDTSDKQNVIKSRLQVISKQIEKYMDLYSLEQLDLNLLKSKIEPLSNEKKSLESALETLVNDSLKRDTQETIHIVEVFKKAVKNKDTSTIHSTLSCLIERIEIDGEDVIIHWNI